MADLTCPACGAHLEVRPAAEGERQRWGDAETEALLREASQHWPELAPGADEGGPE